VARKLRIQYQGAIYHVLSRGDRREPIFLDDQDRERFISTLEQACAKTSWLVHVWCLMANHFHLVVETPQANLVAGMKWFLGTYTSRFNRRHHLSGHLFSGRYKALIVDGSGNGYLKTVCDYVHLNPVRARLVAAEQALETYLWSSYPFYLHAPAVRPSWLCVSRLLGEWGIPMDSAAGRAQFSAGMELRRRLDAPAEETQSLRHGWCLGSETFRRELLAQVAEKRGVWHYGSELYQSAEEKAEKLIAAELKLQRWTNHDLAMRPKGDASKMQLAMKLRAQTTMTISWIAKRLHMGSRGHLANLLGRHETGRLRLAAQLDGQQLLDV
jgi:REP element-mobilizing transposase RayT